VWSSRQVSCAFVRATLLAIVNLKKSIQCLYRRAHIPGSKHLEPSRTNDFHTLCLTTRNGVSLELEGRMRDVSGWGSMTRPDQNWEAARNSTDGRTSNKPCNQNEGGKVCRRHNNQPLNVVASPQVQEGTV
jgi:hypothetical protein